MSGLLPSAAIHSRGRENRQDAQITCLKRGTTSMKSRSGHRFPPPRRDTAPMTDPARPMRGEAPRRKRGWRPTGDLVAVLVVSVASLTLAWTSGPATARASNPNSEGSSRASVASAAAAPSIIRQQVGGDATLVANLARPEGVWQVWEAHTKRGVYDYVLEPGRAPQRMVGAQCRSAVGRALLSLCLWGPVETRFDLAMGRVSARVATLQARTAEGDYVPVARGSHGAYLAISPRSRPAVLLVGRDPKGKALVKKRILDR